MAAPLDPIHPFPCTLPSCYLSFTSVKDMKRHKKEAPDHFYCKKCDVDCLDWADLTRHKVEAMAPWAEGRHVPGTQPAHIVCEFCGEDFKSMGGRRAHREKLHPADQDIVCPGEKNGEKCGEKFTRAAELVYHLEEGLCEMISRFEFEAHIQRKEFVRQIYEDAERMSHVLHEEERSAPIALIEGPNQVIGADDFELLAAANRTAGSEENSKPASKKVAGEDLIDFEDDGGVKIDEGANQHWPPLSPDTASKGMKELSLDSRLHNSPTAYSSKAKPRARVIEQGHSENHWPSIDVFANSRSNSHSQDSVIKPPIQVSSSVWNIKAPSKALFPAGVQETSSPSHNIPKGKASSQQMVPHLSSAAPAPTAEEAPTPQTFFDMLSNAKDIDFETFRDTMTSGYACPFLKCKADCVSFETTGELEAHVYYGHARTVFECKACFKRFPKASRLVAHCESATNCPIQKSKKFQKLINDITGGFIKTRTLHQAKIYQVEGIQSQALIKPDQGPVSGVLRAEFKAAMPSDDKAAEPY